MTLTPAFTPRSTSYQRAPDFEGDEIAGAYRFSCLQCGATLVEDAHQAVERAWSWEAHFRAEEAAMLRRHFDVSTTTGRSPDGGQPVFLRVPCGDCRVDHVVYAGVQETSNLFYAVWIHGIAKVSA
jgi:ribosomal protein S27E